MPKKTRKKKARSSAGSELGFVAGPEAAVDQATSVPVELLAPPSAFSRPPTETRLQELPFQELAWESFEKLCLRLAGLEGKPEHCQRYGTAGQDQEGIDIYARVAGFRPYHTYQCKRYQSLKPSQLRAAVDRFLGSAWKLRCSRFVFCVSLPLERTELADELEVQSARLKTEGVELVPWGATQLSALLKRLPSIVDDFFGRGWVKSFCGEEAARGLGDRLDGTALSRLRADLRGFYRRIFKLHDPGVPSSTSRASAPDLEARYVRPRIVVTDAWTVAPPDIASTDATDPDADGWSRWSPEPAIPDGPHAVEGLIERPLPLEDWLESANRLLVLGPPGAGKSSLLRFIALDSLSDAPTLPRFAQSHPGCIPVWVPFGFWTDLLRQRQPDQCSLRSCLHAWFASHDAGELFSLLDPALRDGRLLLLVDGIDEWKTPDLAGLAIQRLVEFINKYETPLICSSRPYGLERASEVDPTIVAGVLAELDRVEQRTLVSTWYTYWLGKDDRGVASLASVKADEFAAAIGSRPDLARLARNPMLLVLLAQTWLYQQVLPDNSFAAYERLVDHLHNDHPRLRGNAASVRGDGSTLSKSEQLDWLSYLAFWMQENGVLEATRDTMHAKLVAQLRTEGFDAAESRKAASAVLWQASDAPALLVNTSSTHAGFLHRSILEHLAARWILNLSLESQLRTVAERVADPGWREVVLGVLQGARRDERPQLIATIQAAADTHLDSASPRIILAEAAFGAFGLAPQLARSLATSAVEMIDGSSSAALRRQLARVAVNGLRSERVANLTRDAIMRWFPSGSAYRPHVYSALGTLAPGDDLCTALLRALNDDDPVNQRAAGEALAKTFAGDGATFETLTRMVARPVRPSTQAASLRALGLGWLDAAELRELSAQAVDSPSGSVRLVGHAIRTSINAHDRDDARDLLGMVARGGVHLEYGWKDLVLELLGAHWGDSERLREAVRDGMQDAAGSLLGDEEAWTLAVSLLPGDRLGASLVCSALRDPKGYKPGHDWFWRYAATHPDDPDVRGAVEQWTEKQQGFDNDAYAAAAAFPTETMKQLALRAARNPKHWPFWCLHALVENWSLSDPDVEAAVRQYAGGTSTEQAHVAPFLRQLQGEREGYGQLLRLLQDATCTRRDLVMRAVFEVPDVNLMEVAEAFLMVDLPRHHREFGTGLPFLLSKGVRHPALLRLVEEVCERRGEMLGAIVRGYGNDPEFRARLIVAAVPASLFVRRAVTEELERSPGDGPTRAVLVRWRDEEDAVTRATAVRAYAVRYGASDATLADQLVKEATCYGPDYEERRQAALCGLLVLRKVDLLDDIRESIGEPTPVRIPLAPSAHRVNPVATQVLAQNWDYLTGVWAKDSTERLEGLRKTPGGELDLLSRVADWVEAETPLGAHMLQLIEFSGAAVPPGLLGFLSRALPGSPLLLNQCLEVLGVRGAAPSNDITLQARAAEILARQFASDAVLSELLLNAGDRFPSPGVLVAMCRAWPGHEWLTATYERAVAEGARSSALGVFELRCARAPAAGIVAQVRELVATEEPRNFQQRRSFLPALIRRIQRDPDVAAQMAALMQSDTDKLSLRVAGARLSAASLGPSDEVRAWSSRFLIDAARGPLWPTAFDVMTGRIRCAQDLVWEMLGTVA